MFANKLKYNQCRVVAGRAPLSSFIIFFLLFFGLLCTAHLCHIRVQNRSRCPNNTDGSRLLGYAGVGQWPGLSRGKCRLKGSTFDVSCLCLPWLPWQACINKAMGSPTIICMTKGRGHSHRRQRGLSVPHFTHVGK